MSNDSKDDPASLDDQPVFDVLADLTLILATSRELPELHRLWLLDRLSRVLDGDTDPFDLKRKQGDRSRPRAEQLRLLKDIALHQATHKSPKTAAADAVAKRHFISSYRQLANANLKVLARLRDQFSRWIGSEKNRRVLAGERRPDPPTAEARALRQTMQAAKPPRKEVKEKR